MSSTKQRGMYIIPFPWLGRDSYGGGGGHARISHPRRAAPPPPPLQEVPPLTGIPPPPPKTAKHYTNTVVSIPHIRPLLLHANIRQNRGGDLCKGIIIFPCDDHYRPIIATWTGDLCTFTCRLIEKKDRVSFDMIHSYGF